MLNLSKIQPVLDILESTSPRQYSSNAEKLKQQIEEITGDSVEWDGGITTTALVFSDCVIKWPCSSAAGHHAHTSEVAEHQQVMARANTYGVARHLAETLVIGDKIIQEFILPAARTSDCNNISVFIETLVDTALAVGLFDIHRGNWGFRPGDLKTPVIFDFSGQINRRQITDAADIMNALNMQCWDVGENAELQRAVMKLMHKYYKLDNKAMTYRHRGFGA